MFLKALEIQGFKSFPDKTRLDFEEGLTTVVGPNGSGKSNIADAISWVMGEQSAKNLRGGKMEDVIFDGTQKRRATGFAQVSITFDNQDHFFDIEAEEVTLTRKYYRSGESGYSINKNSVRLKDVHELLMDTGLGSDGYSMISQGRIAEIVSAKSGERREIFEEAAGISKYRYRREQAERQLEKAQENILRLKDILLELEGRLDPLRIQSEKAERFVFLTEEKKDLEISVQMEQLSRLREVLKENDNRMMVVRTEYDGVEEKLERIEAEMDSVYQSISQCSMQMERVQKEKKELEEASAESKSQKAVLENDIFHRQENIRRLEKEEELLLGGEESIVVEKEHCQKNLLALQEQQRLLEKQWVELTEKKVFLLESDSRQGNQMKEITQTKNDAERALAQAELIMQTSLSTKAEIEHQLHQFSLTETVSEENQEKLGLEIETMNRFFESVQKKQEDYQKKAEDVRRQYEKRQSEIVQREKTISMEELYQKEILHRIKLLEDMENSMEDAPRSVKTVMKLQNTGKLQGILGTVAQQLEVPREVALAIETALGGSLQNLVVEKEADGKLAIEVLKKENAGRATFLPLDTMKGRTLDTRSFEKAEGFMGILSERVRFYEKTRPVMEFLMGRIALCDTLDHASALAKANRYQFRVVTLDGQLINAGGSLTGGSRVRQNGVLSRRVEIENLTAKHQENSGKISEEKDVLSRQKEEILSFSRDIGELEGEIRLLESDLLKTRYQKDAAEKTLLEGRHWRENATEEKRTFTVRLAKLESLVCEQESIKTEKHKELLEIENLMQTLSLGGETLYKAREELQNELNELKIQKMALEKDAEAVSQRLLELEQRKNHQTEQLETLENSKTAEKKSIEILSEKIERRGQSTLENTKNILYLEKEYGDWMEKRRTLESSSTENRQAEKELMGHRENLSKEMTRLEEQKRGSSEAYDKVVAALWDEYEMTVSEARALARPVENLQKLNQTLLGLRAEIRNLGSINVSAIEEYREVKERYTFLTIQCEDVEKSREGLLSLIGELTRTMEVQFADTFSEINTHFSLIFRELFGGGNASLELLNPESVLESGIEIHVQPPGKIVKNLTALSGGEQSLVAISIYFAILKVRPSPFCLLDEIEAALDDVNVGRFATYLCSMTENTQFIAISHRRGTMEAADVLYGVTMQEEGVSKLLRLNLGEVEEKLGMKAQ